MKKTIIFIIGIAFGLFIGVFSVLIWEEKTKKNSEIIPEEVEEVVEETSTGVENTGTKEIVLSEKRIEEINSIFNNSSYYSQYSEFLQKGKLINESSFRVFDVLSDSQALVYGKDKYGYYNGVVYLLIDKVDSEMYDDQIIEVPKGKVAKRHGIYQYRTRNGTYKTVPKIMIVAAD